MLWFWYNYSCRNAPIDGAACTLHRTTLRKVGNYLSDRYTLLVPLTVLMVYTYGLLPLLTFLRWLWPMDRNGKEASFLSCNSTNELSLEHLTHCQYLCVIHFILSILHDKSEQFSLIAFAFLTRGLLKLIQIILKNFVWNSKSLCKNLTSWLPYKLPFSWK